MKIIPALTLLCLLTACVSTPPIRNNSYSDPFDRRDPIKPVNQAIFKFNLVADKYVVKPVAETYHYVPELGRAMIGNFLSNLSEPGNFVNGLLQLDSNIAFTAFWRFTLNSTFGLGGLQDFAGETNLKGIDTDFGKTLGTYGIADGAYLVLPLAGPSTVRDTAGIMGDFFLDPVGWYLTTPQSIAQDVANAIIERDENAPIINQLYYESIEPYAATRASYLQHLASPDVQPMNTGALISQKRDE